ncbi:protein of unknown function [Paraburkholderia kururiensis]
MRGAPPRTDCLLRDDARRRMPFRSKAVAQARSVTRRARRDHKTGFVEPPPPEGGLAQPLSIGLFLHHRPLRRRPRGAHTLPPVM